MRENEMNVQAPAFEELAVAEKPRSKKGILIGAVAAFAVIAVVVAVLIGVLSGSPLNLLATGFRNSMEALKGNDFTDRLEQAGNGGSMELSAELSTLLKGSGLPLSGTGSLKMYMDQEGQKAAMTLGVQLGGQTLDASIFGNQESVVIASDWLLGDKAYGVELKSFVEDFNKSVFRMDGPCSLGIELPENLQEQMTVDPAYADDTAKITEQLATRLVTSLEKNATMEKEKATLTLGGEDVKTTAVTVKMEPDQLAAFVEDLLEYLRTDEACKQYLEAYKENLFANAALGADDADMTADQILKMLEESKQQILEDEMALEAVFHITKSGKQLIGIELILKDNTQKEPITVSVCAGPDLEDLKEIRFQVTSDEENAQGTYTVKTNDKGAFAAAIELSENGQAVLKTDIRWDKQTGAWEIALNGEQYKNTVIRGTLEKSDKEISAKLDSVETAGEKMELGIGMVLRAADKMPEIPQYTQLLAMTEDEAKGLVQDVSMIILQLLYGMA